MALPVTTAVPNCCCGSASYHCCTKLLLWLCQLPLLYQTAAVALPVTTAVPNCCCGSASYHCCTKLLLWLCQLPLLFQTAAVALPVTTAVPNCCCGSSSFHYCTKLLLWLCQLPLLFQTAAVSLPPAVKPPLYCLSRTAWSCVCFCQLTLTPCLQLATRLCYSISLAFLQQPITHIFCYFRIRMPSFHFSLLPMWSSTSGEKTDLHLSLQRHWMTFKLLTV